jgi:hypothetical protein
MSPCPRSSCHSLVPLWLARQGIGVRLQVAMTSVRGNCGSSVIGSIGPTHRLPCLPICRFPRRGLSTRPGADLLRSLTRGNQHPPTFFRPTSSASTSASSSYDDQSKVLLPSVRVPPRRPSIASIFRFAQRAKASRQEQADLSNDGTLAQALCTANVLQVVFAEKPDTRFTDAKNATTLQRLVRKGMVTEDSALHDALHPVFDRVIRLVSLPKEDDEVQTQMSGFRKFVYRSVDDGLQNATALRGTVLMLRSVVQATPDRIEPFSVLNLLLQVLRAGYASCRQSWKSAKSRCRSSARNGACFISRGMLDNTKSTESVSAHSVNTGETLTLPTDLHNSFRPASRTNLPTTSGLPSCAPEIQIPTRLRSCSCSYVRSTIHLLNMFIYCPTDPFGFPYCAPLVHDDHPPPRRRTNDDLLRARDYRRRYPGRQHAGRQPQPPRHYRLPRRHSVDPSGRFAHMVTEKEG